MTLKKFPCTRSRCLSIVKRSHHQPRYCEWRIAGKCGWTKKGAKYVGGMGLSILHTWSKGNKALEVSDVV